MTAHYVRSNCGQRCVRIDEPAAVGPWTKCHVFTETELEDLCVAIAVRFDIDGDAVRDMLAGHVSEEWVGIPDER